MPYPSFQPHPDDIGFTTASKSPIRTSAGPSTKMLSATSNDMRAPVPTQPQSPIRSKNRQSTASSRSRPPRRTTYLDSQASDIEEEPNAYSVTSAESSDGDSEYTPALEGQELELKPSVYSDSDSDSASKVSKSRRRSTPSTPKGKRRRSPSGAARSRSGTSSSTPKRHKAGSIASHHPGAAQSTAIHNAPYTAEEDWALFCCLYPMASPPDLGPAMASTGRDKIVCLPVCRSHWT